MEELKTPKKLSYYQKNKTKYKKGGKYYKYIPKADRTKGLKFEIVRGQFLISFD
tara:strand:- start:395 stop:556 length:162 start_codon:yes stop_codon:yes gene_type:complete